MTNKSAFSIAITAGILTLLSGCDREPATSYKKDVVPILSKYCNECHLPQGKGTENTGFVVDTYDSVMKGTNYGPVIVAGDSTSSTFYRLVTGKVDKSIEMPHDKTDKLSADEIMVIQKWIDQGAKNN